jgi:hypothetical protein
MHGGYGSTTVQRFVAKHHVDLPGQTAVKNLHIKVYGN